MVACNLHGNRTWSIRIGICGQLGDVSGSIIPTSLGTISISSKFVCVWTANLNQEICLSLIKISYEWPNNSKQLSAYHSVMLELFAKQKRPKQPIKIRLLDKCVFFAWQLNFSLLFSPFVDKWTLPLLADLADVILNSVVGVHKACFVKLGWLCNNAFRPISGRHLRGQWTVDWVEWVDTSVGFHAPQVPLKMQKIRVDKTRRIWQGYDINWDKTGETAEPVRLLALTVHLSSFRNTLAGWRAMLCQLVVFIQMKT